MGVSFATNTVKVNDQAAYRKGEYFRKELFADNTNAALWTNITVTATGQTPVTGNVFVPKTPEQFAYDSDGNLTNDGRWAYTWDAENRLDQDAAQRDCQRSGRSKTQVGLHVRLAGQAHSKGRLDMVRFCLVSGCLEPIPLRWLESGGRTQRHQQQSDPLLPLGHPT